MWLPDVGGEGMGLKFGVGWIMVPKYVHFFIPTIGWAPSNYKVLFKKDAGSKTQEDGNLMKEAETEVMQPWAKEQSAGHFWKLEEVRGVSFPREGTALLAPWF